MAAPRDLETTTIAGHLLCAVPQLMDPNFHRAVVLLLEHDEGGTIGLVLNSPTATSVSDVATSLEMEWSGDPNAAVRQGGPVETMRGWVFHGQPSWDPAASEVASGLLLTTSLDSVIESEGRQFGAAGRFLFLLGYAGWDGGQLEAEIAAGSWVLVPIRGRTDASVGVSPAWILDADPAQMWEEALATIGVDPLRLVGMQGRGSVMQ